LATLDKNGFTKAARVKFSFHLKGEFKVPLAEYGLLNETVNDVPVTLPVSVTVGGEHYATDRSFTYTAKQDKSGKAKNVP